MLIGTTDLDLQRTVVWNVGAIAQGRSPDKVSIIRDILLASSSVPLLFPPVYFNVAFEGKVYQQMHVDGGIESPLLVPGLLSEFEAALQAAGLKSKIPKVVLYALVNQQVAVENTKPVNAGMTAIAMATINHSQRSNLASNLARLRLLSQAQGVEMKVLSIPPEVRLERDSLDFDQAEMMTLSEMGLRLGATLSAWK